MSVINYARLVGLMIVINKEYRYIETYEDEKLDKLIYRELYRYPSGILHYSDYF